MASIKTSTENGWTSLPYSSRKYIDDIPPDQRANLCTEIDYTIHRNEGYWQKLIGKLGFDETHSKKFRLSFEMRGSPTDNLLRDCSYRMMRIRYLYQVLKEIGLFHVAEEYLRDYDTEEPLPIDQLPSLPIMTNNFSFLSSRPSTGLAIGNGLEKVGKKKAGASWLAIQTYHFSYDEIKAGTNNFGHSMELGAGAFGKVYKVVLNNTLFACKVLKIDNDNPLTTSIIETHRQHDDLRNELNYLAEYRHPNVIALYGWSLDGPDPCLIYDYMKNGSLQDRLQCLNSSKPMNWEIRVRVSCGAARGLQFLHSMKSKPLIHGDIKTANILLDDSYTAKLGDFGLAREMPRNATTGSYIRLDNEHTPGTLGYLANEYITTKKLSVQVDTFAFGVVLLELYTGRRAYDRNKDTPLLRDYMHDIADEAEDIGEERANQKLLGLLDPQIPKLPQDIALEFVKISLSCCHEKRKERPKMSDTLSVLEGLNRSLAEASGRKPDGILPNLTDRTNQTSGLNHAGNHGTNTIQRQAWLARHNEASLAPSEVPSLSRVPVESVDHSLIAGSLAGQNSGNGRKLSAISLGRQMEQLRASRASSSDESDSQGHSSPNSTNSGLYYVRPGDGGLALEQMPKGYQQPPVPSPQYGYYPSHRVGAGSHATHHTPQYPSPSNAGEAFYKHGYPNDIVQSMKPNEGNDLYGPGPYSCPAQHGNRANVENPFNLDLSRAPRPPCTCNTFQSPQHNLSPLQSSPWPGQECTPGTFTSLDLEFKSVKQSQLNEARNNEAGEASVAPNLPSANHTKSRRREAAEAKDISQKPHHMSSLPRPGSFHLHSVHSTMSDGGYMDGANFSALPPLSINPIKKSMLDMLEDGQSYTQIFGEVRRKPTEGTYADGHS